MSDRRSVSSVLESLRQTPPSAPAARVKVPAATGNDKSSLAMCILVVS
jgi:hypothetical protein